ncbi:HlyD family secretion protein [Vibrio variabilis]|uniref:HlyD family secretion protein n=1 Tax=Vibrio variabilis TaxID=990271 RepID=UPI000DD88457|nr:HlyD family efflux transporter periplasmic adaptor subunit [Vibrio variabilis]
MKRSLLVIIPLVLALLGCQNDDNGKALGTLERDRISFSSTANEIIRELPVREGTRVKTGDVLVRLDTKRQEAVLAHAIAEEAKASAYLLRLTNGERPEDIAAAKAQVDMAEAKLTEAQKNYSRASELVRKKLASQSQKDQAVASRDTARAELNSAKEEFSKLTAGSRPEDITQAEAALAAAKADVALQTQQLDELTITATRDGILDSLPYNLGERVSVGAFVAVVLADRIPYARVYVPSSVRVKFVPGLQVNVHVDGLDEVLAGTVRWVAADPSFTPYYALTEDERSRLMYLAEIDLPESAESLPTGVPAQVDLQGLK